MLKHKIFIKFYILNIQILLFIKKYCDIKIDVDIRYYNK